MQDVVLTSRFSIPRPSEQWEVVMEDIEERDETMGTASSKNSLKTVSNGEFGTRGSRSTVSSSIKAFATSLGIKHGGSKSSHTFTDSASNSPNKVHSFSPSKLLGGNSTRARDSLAEHAIPYDHIPPSDSLPETDHFKFSTPDSSILGIDDDYDMDADGDARSTARSSIRLGPAGVRSTIRLVSHPAAVKSARADNHAFMSPPKLPVVKTDFDLVAGTPATVRTLNMWPATPRSVAPSVDEGRLYPKLPLDDDDDEGEMPGAMQGPTATATPAKPVASTSTGPVDEPDMFSPSKPTAVPRRPAPTPAHNPSIPRSAPFLFGSPLPRHPAPAKQEPEEEEEADREGAGVSNAAFDGIAKSVLEEMHRRLAEANKDKPAPPSTSMSPTQPQFAFAGLQHTQAAETQDRFAKVHEAEFSKMDSIATHYAARRPAKRKSDALGRGRPSAGQKRRSSAAGARVISVGARKKMAVPGGFGGASDEDEEGQEDEGESERDGEDEDAGARRSSKRMRITEGWDVHRAGQRVSLAPPLSPAEEEKKTRQREAVKRELDAAKARRRSSRGRPSIGVPPPKAKSRFGFFGAAKSLVRNVWNIGGGSKAKAVTANPPPSSIPVPKPSQPPAITTADKKGDKAKASALPSAASAPRKASGSNKLLKPPPAAVGSNAGSITSTKSSSSRSRSPIPSFAAGSVKSIAPAASRPSSIAGTTRSWVSSTTAGNSTTGRTSTVSSLGTGGRTSTVSSMGTRTGTASGSTAVSSMGTRRSVASTSTLASTSSKADAKALEQPSLRKRTSSLLAPTASSLAKAVGRPSGLPPVAEQEKERPKRMSAAQLSSSARASLASPPSPRPGRIFSQPLTNLPMGSSSPHPSPPTSLAAAAAALMGAAAGSPSKIPRPAAPKPKQLVARRPRISRSKVITRLGAKREAAARGSGSGAGAGGRTRSSMGARRSFGGVKPGRASAGAEAMRGAVKKRARQSEYVRRRSRAMGENASVAGED